MSPPGSVTWQQQGPPSPSSVSSGSTSPGYSPSRVLDLSGSSTSFSSDRRSHNWQNGPVQEWSKDQVLNMEHAFSISNKIKYETKLILCICFPGLPVAARPRSRRAHIEIPRARCYRRCPTAVGLAWPQDSRRFRWRQVQVQAEAQGS